MKFWTKSVATLSSLSLAGLLIGCNPPEDAVTPGPGTGTNAVPTVVAPADPSAMPTGTDTPAVTPPITPPASDTPAVTPPITPPADTPAPAPDAPAPDAPK